MWVKGWLLSIAGEPKEAVSILASGIRAWRSTGATLFAPTQLSCLAVAYAKLGQLDDARRGIHDAMTAMKGSKERWFEPEVNRLAREIALLQKDKAKSRNVLRARTRSHSPATSKMLGTPRRHESCTPLA
jgi:hypothetical protein